MEKKTPHYDLSEVKRLILEDKYIITGIAFRAAFIIFKYNKKRIIETILNLDSDDFYKSMTSIYTHKIWQDVYHKRIDKKIAYIKVNIENNKSVIISFKEKENL